MLKTPCLEIYFWLRLTCFRFFAGCCRGRAVGKKKNADVLVGYDGRFFAFVVTLSLSLLTGNLVLLLGGIGFLAVLPLSYYRQKRIILAEEAEKERLRKIEREFKRQAVIKNVVDKVKADDYSRFMPKAENREA